jgi:ABC-2 type transport system ATP-binding protein
MTANTCPLMVQQISKKYGKHIVLENISLQLNAGEIFGLVGLNGIGKTTLIKIILDLSHADAGNVTVFGVPSTQVRAREKLSYLPEKFSPSRYLKGYEYLQLAMAHYGLAYDAAQAEAIAASLDLDVAALARKVGSYSKGMGQKLGLLGAFMVQQPLLVLDEPMSGLDPAARIRVKQHLLKEKAAGRTIFFSSHILADIEEICDRIAIIHNGHVIYLGTAAQFKPSYGADNLEQAFLRAMEAAPRKVA